MVRKKGRGAALVLALVLPLLAGAALGGDAQAREFTGRVEAFRKAEVSTLVNGVIKKLLFRGGERVSKGDLLARLDDADARLALASAEALATQRRAELVSAEHEAERTENLVRRGVSSTATQDSVRAMLARAEAAVRRAEIAVAQARLTLSRAEIRAPISGRISRPKPVLGGYIEADAGAPLATIVQIDPVLVAYPVPYAVRRAAVREAGVERLEQLFDRIEVRVATPSGAIHPQVGKPVFADATVDPETGALTTWARLPNPDGSLRPGMQVQVMTSLRPEGSAAAE